MDASFLAVAKSIYYLFNYAEYIGYLCLLLFF